MELDEAIRLYELNKDSELTIHGKLPIIKYQMFTNYVESNLFILNIIQLAYYYYDFIKCR